MSEHSVPFAQIFNATTASTEQPKSNVRTLLTWKHAVHFAQTAYIAIILDCLRATPQRCAHFPQLVYSMTAIIKSSPKAASKQFVHFRTTRLFNDRTTLSSFDSLRNIVRTLHKSSLNDWTRTKQPKSVPKHHMHLHKWSV